MHIVYTALIIFFFFIGSAQAGAVLKWTDNSDNEDGFHVYRADSIVGNYVNIGSVGPNVITFTDAGGAAGHCYRVTAYNKAGESQPTNTACLLIVVPIPAGGLSVILQ